jgi:phage terminase small subunit
MEDGMSKKAGLTPKRRAFVRALLVEKDTKAAAKAAGVAERTAYRWVGEPAIQGAILDAEGDALEAVTRGLLRLAHDAVDTLGDAMGDKEAATSARVRAADIVLQRLLQLRELVTLEERLSALEAAQEGDT